MAWRCSKPQGRSPQTHVIFFSGQDSLEVAVESLKNGADDYIVKSNASFALVKPPLTRSTNCRSFAKREAQPTDQLGFALGWVSRLLVWPSTWPVDPSPRSRKAHFLERWAF